MLIAGAGRIGQAISRLLGPCREYSLTVADCDHAALAQVSPEHATRVTADLCDREVVGRLLVDADVVISACPYYMNPLIASAAVSSGAHYFDLTEDVQTTRHVRELAPRASTVLMPQCGLAPGFVSIAAFDLAQRFDSLQRLCMRVGAIPRFPSNVLKYNLTWSTEGLINEYCNPCETILEGERREVIALEGLEEFSLDGTRYEAFNTSGGLGSLCETLQGKLGELSYKTIRYPGHRDLIRFLVDDLRLRDQRDVLKGIFERALPVTGQDVVIVFVTASGLRDGAFTEETYVHRVPHAHIAGRPMAAIQLTTAAGVCAMVDLLREGRLPSSGFVRQEDVSMELFLANRFGRHYDGGYSSTLSSRGELRAAE
ncbi:MAG TPA: saccharopine dehydrogenase C-terminal domain-containing protein [Polyangiales bacterium]|nr:saccharopine dehydrogenase C-terminal domain-containing protein [Polyangiales bacterium]